VQSHKLTTALARLRTLLPAKTLRGGGASQTDDGNSEEVDSVSESPDAAGSSQNQSSSAKAAPAAFASDISIFGENALGQIKNDGTFVLDGDVYQNDTVWINGNVTIDLNGHHTIYYKGSTSLFHVKKGGKLVIKDSSPVTDSVSKPSGNVTGNEASISWNDTKPSNLTYYVTESTPSKDGTSTTESLVQHSVTPGGVITAENSSGANSVIYMEGGELDIEGGMFTMPNSASHGSNVHIINVEGGIFNLSGGYICGGQRTGNYGGGVNVNGSNAIFNMSGGVIAANKAKSGAGVYANGAKVSLSGGVISGNTVAEGTYDYNQSQAGNGYGGGIYASGSQLTISDGCYITNNRVEASYTDRHTGLIGGGGVAIFGGSSSLKMSGGYVTGNYSNEAGGGIYAGQWNSGLGSADNCQFIGGTIASNVAQNSEGGGIRIGGSDNGIGTNAIISCSEARLYVTNNKCNSKDDWGGGGVFVQQGGDLIVKNALVTRNTSGGYGAGVSACPTGETFVTHTNGAAIYDNTDEVNDDSPHYVTPNKYGKIEDYTVTQNDDAFKANDHSDYFLVREKQYTSYITAITGRMLGNGGAGWSGSVDGNAVKVNTNSGIQAHYLVGLTAQPTDAAKTAAINVATVIFSGNYAYNHGGGIMTNGGLTLGEPQEIDTYPGLILKANKVLTQDGKSVSLGTHRYTFELLRATNDKRVPKWNDDGTFDYNGCEVVSSAVNDEKGEIELSVGKDFQAGKYSYFLVEKSGEGSAVNYDKTIYQIDIGVKESSRSTLLNIPIVNYGVDSINVTVIPPKSGQSSSYKPSYTTDASSGSVSFTLTKDGKNTAAFTNELAPYKTTGSFTPQVEKHVDGGEMKEFKFELYGEGGFANGKFTGTPIQSKTTTKSEDREATVTFDKIDYQLELSDLDTHKRGGEKTYTYYVREEPGSDSGYTYDDGYYKIVVTAQDTPATDKLSGTLKITAKYTYVDANGKSTEVSENEYPKFNNKYATELPSAGQAGITIAYVAGAAALGYGVWRLVKARGKSRRGGE